MRDVFRWKFAFGGGNFELIAKSTLCISWQLAVMVLLPKIILNTLSRMRVKKSAAVATCLVQDRVGLTSKSKQRKT